MSAERHVSKRPIVQLLALITLVMWGGVAAADVPRQPATTTAGQYRNLDASARFVPTTTVRASYLRAPQAAEELPSHVSLEVKGQRMELGIVDTRNPEMARAVSSLLTRSLEDAKDSKGGYAPSVIVERVQKHLISPHGVTNRWGAGGRRFVLSRQVDGKTSEILATMLVSAEHDNIFFYTNRFTNVRLSALQQDVDFALPADVPGKRWFEKYHLVPPARHKPEGFHHIANVVVAKEGRGLGLSRVLIDGVVGHYTRAMEQLTHGQPTFDGKGFWQIGDPPWLARMARLGFFPRLGAEQFFRDVPWEKLPEVRDPSGKPIDHIAYNGKWELPSMYQNLLQGKESPFAALYQQAKAKTGSAVDADHLLERIPQVMNWATSGNAKLQYFQLLFPFENWRKYGAHPVPEGGQY